MGRHRNAWVEELLHAMWAHRTMAKTSPEETPFSLTYGTKAMIPTKIGLPTNRMYGTKAENEEDLRLNLNLAEETREMAARREVEYKKKIRKYYKARVREVKFRMSNLVLMENEASRQEDQGKLGPCVKVHIKLSGLEEKVHTN